MGSSCGDYGCWCLVDSEVTPDNKFRFGKSWNGFVVWRLWLLVFGLWAQLGWLESHNQQIFWEIPRVIGPSKLIFLGGKFPSLHLKLGLYLPFLLCAEEACANISLLYWWLWLRASPKRTLVGKVTSLVSVDRFCRLWAYYLKAKIILVGTQ